MTLSAQDKKRLRALGQTKSDDARLGKAGIESSLQHLRELLARQELVKVRFNELEGDERRKLADDVAAALDAELVAVVGRTILLYRANEALDPAKRALG